MNNNFLVLHCLIHQYGPHFFYHIQFFAGLISHMKIQLVIHREFRFVNCIYLVDSKCHGEKVMEMF